MIAAQIVVTGGRFVSGARRKVFTAEFFRKAKESGLLEEHKKATGSDKLPTGGYPDMGSGRYSAFFGAIRVVCLAHEPVPLPPPPCSRAAPLRGLAALQQRAARALQLH